MEKGRRKIDGAFEQEKKQALFGCKLGRDSGGPLAI